MDIKTPWVTWLLRINRVALMNKDNIIHSSHSTEDTNQNLYFNTLTKKLKW